MTPKQKAAEIIDKFLCIDDDSSLDLFCPECGMSVDAAKQCALIAVKNEYNSLREQLMNLLSFRIIKNEETYLHRLNMLDTQEFIMIKQIENYE